MTISEAGPSVATCDYNRMLPVPKDDQARLRLDHSGQGGINVLPHPFDDGDDGFGRSR